VTLFSELVGTSQVVSDASARSAKVAALAQCLGRLGPEEVAVATAVLGGDLPQGRIGIGYASIRDVNPPAAETAELAILEVDAVLTRIKGMSGAGSKAARLRALDALLRRADADEQHFLKRLLIGELRQGALEGVMIEAVARAAELPAARVRRAVMMCGELPVVARAALTEGGSALDRFGLELFRPLQPMLAQTAADVEDALARLDRAALEWKLDGARVQVHRRDDEVRVFSRRLNDVTAAVPEIVEVVRALPVGQLVLDGEVIALRPDGTPQPFQVTMRRFGRRADVQRMRSEIPLVPFFFDCLHLDGRDLIDHESAERQAAAAEILPEGVQVPRLVTDVGEEAAAFLASALEAGHEGVVAKSLAAPYEAGRRGAGWLKIKPAHTLDLVVLAAEWGSGRRQGWLSNLHLGARDPTTGGFVMLGKTFKGMTDEILAWQTTRLQQLEVARDEYTVFVRPELVVEVAFDGVQSSPQYPGGMALRFARVKRYRPDKSADQADTVERVRAIHAGRE
jgi:DNA ligase-1